MKSRKYVLLVIILSIFLFLVACDPSPYKHDYEDLIECVTDIQLIKYDNPSSKEVFKKRDKVKSLDIEKITVVETLPTDRKEEFLKMLCDCLFMKSVRHQDSPNGWCIILRFENGNFELVAVNQEFSGIFDSEGRVVEFIGSGLRAVHFKDYFEEHLA